MMIRSFLPVGQGAFYKETFMCGDEKVNIVYDCGSATDKNIVDENIKNNFEEKEIINAIFISHFDDDHINGLPHLLKYCVVKKIFFPLLTKESKALTQLCEIVNNKMNSVAYKFIENPRNYIQSIVGDGTQPVLFGVRENGQNDFENYWQVESIESGKNASGYIHPLLESDFEKWEYIPFNYKEPERSPAVKEALKKQYPDKEISDIPQICIDNPDEIDKVKEAFSSVLKDFNSNSMVLFSGIKDSGLSQCLCDVYARDLCYDDLIYWHLWRGNKHYPSGCLYMGDYDASGIDKWRSLRDAYSDYWDSIGCIQVPHHGSKNNYNCEIGDLNGYHIISAGRHNRHSHPHSVVIHDILLKRKPIFWVTEQRETQVDIICEWYY